MSLGLVEKIDLPFLPDRLIPDGRLVRRTKGLTAITAGVRLNPMLWRKATRALSGLIFALEALVVDDFVQRGSSIWIAVKEYDLVSALETRISKYADVLTFAMSSEGRFRDSHY